MSVQNAREDVSSRSKRARSQLSCTHCRHGKLKCNRSDPCDQCTKRNRESTCTYLALQKSKAGQNVKSRINHLEQLVIELMKSKADETHTAPSTEPQLVSEPAQQSASALTPPEDADSRPALLDHEQHLAADPDITSYGKIKVNGDQTSYVGDSHWTSILDSISDLKNDLDDDDDHQDHGNSSINADADDNLDEDAPEGISFLLRSPPRRSKADLIKELPRKEVLDRLLLQWFNGPDPFKMTVHPATFQEEYSRFWRNPSKAPTMWIGLLFSIISVSMNFTIRDQTDMSSPQAQLAIADLQRYHELAASAAVLADYTSPKEYTIECLLFYSASMRSRNAFGDVWELLGLTVRLALRMGYHRDGSHYPNLTPFQCEMRRRTWHCLYMIDILVSFQMGQPLMLQAVQSDTQVPGNYQDADLSPRMTAMPVPRSREEITPVSYARVKATIFPVFAEIVDLSHSTVVPPYERVMQLDARIEEVTRAIPQAVRVQPLDQSITVESERIVWRYNVALLLLKCKMVLHRRFMKSSGTEHGGVYSQRTCVDAAMQTLRYHREIHEASKAGGQMSVPKWYLNSISTHDFLLAAMILCLELAQRCGMSIDGMTYVRTASAPQQDMVELLESTKRVWEELTLDAMPRGCPDPTISQAYREQSLMSEFSKASKALSVMLARVRARYPTSSTATVEQGARDIANPGNTATSAGPWSTDTTLNDGDFLQSTDISAMDVDYSMLGDMVNVPDLIDWDLWDRMSGLNSGNETQTNEWLLDPVMDPTDMNDILLEHTSK